MEKLKAVIGFVFAIGCVILIMVGFGSAVYLDSRLERDAKNIIEKCELNIPRNKKCKLMAVVDDNTTSNKVGKL